MAKIQVGIVNFNVVGTQMGLEIKTGKKNVVMQNDQVYISGVITDKENGLADIDYVGARKGNKTSCKDIANQIMEIQKAHEESQKESELQPA